ncbi:MAG: hypothetical protein PHP93_08020 [Kiritimatiellales bacterium]|nr:hypothetical protein [Kiritimatiellales bacterium]
MKQNAPCGMKDDALFQWGRATAVAGGNAKSSGRKSDRLACMLRKMIFELERVRVLHWQYFHERFGWSDRTCRDVANFSDGYIISFSGGYVLNIKAKPEEFAEGNGRIRSQGEKMIHRADREQQVREELCGVTV